MTTAEGTASAGSSSASHRMTDELASDANRLKHTAAERAKQEADVRKVDAARAAKSASSALDKADAELDRDANAPRWLTAAFHQAAGSIERPAPSSPHRPPPGSPRRASCGRAPITSITTSSRTRAATVLKPVPRPRPRSSPGKEVWRDDRPETQSRNQPVQ